MLPRRAVVLAACLAAAAAAAAARAAAQLDPWFDPARVLVIYNTSWPDGDADGVPDSVEVAQYYAARRGVPADNLLGLPLTPASWSYDSSQWSLFLTEMRDPLQAWLAAHGTDSVDTLLFCYGATFNYVVFKYIWPVYQPMTYTTIMGISVVLIFGLPLLHLACTIGLPHSTPPKPDPFASPPLRADA